MEKSILFSLIFIFIISVVGLVFGILGYKKHEDEHKLVKGNLTVGKRLMFLEDYNVLVKDHTLTLDNNINYLDLTYFGLSKEYKFSDDRVFKSFLFDKNLGILFVLYEEEDNDWQCKYWIKIPDPDQLIENVTLKLYWGKYTEGTRHSPDGQIIITNKDDVFEGSIKIDFDNFYNASLLMLFCIITLKDGITSGTFKNCDLNIRVRPH